MRFPFNVSSMTLPGPAPRGSPLVLVPPPRPSGPLRSAPPRLPRPPTTPTTNRVTQRANTGLHCRLTQLYYMSNRAAVMKACERSSMELRRHVVSRNSRLSEMSLVALILLLLEQRVLRENLSIILLRET